MPSLPTGTITFLLTDVEGSTTRWERHPEQMRVALAEHDALIEFLTEQHHGQVVRPRGEGDSRFCVFAEATQASDAVAAAVAIQRALHAAPWPSHVAIRVRIAVHTGEAELREGDYYGSDVNRAARLRSAGHGGQTLLSGATVAQLGGALAGDALPAGTTLRDLGERRLKDLIQPEHVWQLVVAGLPNTFPPLLTLDVRPNNLPIQATALVGRERQVREVRALLARPAVRLLTLTGPGGTGKTRLALQVAAEVIDDFDHGVWFVNLAPITDPALVLPAIAQAVGVKEHGPRPLTTLLQDFLQDQRLLLVLDNCEQVVAAAPGIAELLAACAGLKVLSTSRTVLKVYGEHEYAVPPLALPDRHALPSPSALVESEAVALFVQRATARNPDFALTPENAPDVAEICTRLDGLPLALELAAARSKLLPPAQLLARLTNRLHLLTGGARDLPARQQTLRGTIDWSYQLLDPAEQTLFGRLAVFVGGWTLEAAEALCQAESDSPVDVLDGLGSLVDKSLIRQQPGAPDRASGANGAIESDEPRFVMLETIREYALERLAEQGAAPALHARHAAHFLALAEQAEPHLRAADQVAWSARLERELGNLRAVREWTREQGAVEMGLRLGAALWFFWLLRTRFTEGRAWLEIPLARRDAASAAVQARALLAAGSLAWLQGDLVQGRALLRESVARFRDVGDRWGSGVALMLLVPPTRAQGDLEVAGALLKESTAYLREVGDPWALGTVLFGQATGLGEQGAIETARARFAESIALLRTVGERWMLSLALISAGELAFAQEDYPVAGTAFEEAAAAAREIESAVGGLALADAGVVALVQGDHTRAAARLVTALAMVRGSGQRRGISFCLAGLAGAASTQGRWARAARLLGAADALQAAVGFALDPIERAVHDHATAGTRSDRGAPGAPGAPAEDAWARAYAAGQAMSLEQAVTYALEGAPVDAEQPPAAA